MTAGPTLTFESALRHVAATLNELERTAKTQQNYLTNLRRLHEREVSGGLVQPIDALTDALAAWRTEKERRYRLPDTDPAKISASSIYTDVTALKTFYRLVQRHRPWARHWPHDPMRDVNSKPKAKGVPKPVALDVLSKLCQSVPTPMERLMVELLYHGLRATEVARLTTDALRLDTSGAGGPTFYLSIHGKGDKERVLPLSPVGAELLAHYALTTLAVPGFVGDVVSPDALTAPETLWPAVERLMGDPAWWRPRQRLLTRTDGEPITNIWIAKRFERYRRDAGLPATLTAHKLRHSCATYLLHSGLGIEKVKEWLGHEDLRTTLNYAQNMGDWMAQAVRGLPQLSPLTSGPAPEVPA